jgi:hypothetical protein
MSNWNSVKEITNWERGTGELWNSKEKVGVAHVKYEEAESDSASSCYMLFRNRVFLGTVISLNSSNTATVQK